MVISKKGISAVVATVLIILITVAGLTLIWTTIIPMLKENTSFENEMVDLKIVTSEGYTVWDEEKVSASVQIRRGNDESYLNGLQFIFTRNGNSLSENVLDYPEQNALRKFNFNLSVLGGEPDSVAVVPIFSDRKVGSIPSEFSDFPEGKVEGFLILVGGEGDSQTETLKECIIDSDCGETNSQILCVGDNLINKTISYSCSLEGNCSNFTSDSLVEVCFLGCEQGACKHVCSLGVEAEKFSLSKECYTSLSVLNSLINYSTWTLGNGSVTGFTRNGADNENVRELGLNPYGEDDIIWTAYLDAVSDADGGWNTPLVSIDNTKDYVFTVWLKRIGTIDGSSYFGTRSYVGGISLNFTSVSNGAKNSNPYFWSGDLPQFGKWYLLVGYVHNKDYSSTRNFGAMYDGVTGERVKNITDFKFGEGMTSFIHRAYLYSVTTGSPTNRQYFWGPTLNELDPGEVLVI